MIDPPNKCYCESDSPMPLETASENKNYYSQIKTTSYKLCSLQNKCYYYFFWP